MPIANYGDLKAQVAAFLNRNNLTVEIPYFVQLAETRIAYGSREMPFPSEPLRIRAMEICASATFDKQEISLPDDFLQVRRLFIAGDPNGRIDFEVPSFFWVDASSGSAGKPTKYTIEGNSIFLRPSPDGSYTGRILYYKKFAALTDDADTNWLLVNAPSVYLYGTLLEAYKHVRNMEQAQVNLNAFAGTVNSLNLSDKDDRYATPWASVADVYTP